MIIATQPFAAETKTMQSEPPFCLQSETAALSAVARDIKFAETPKKSRLGRPPQGLATDFPIEVVEPIVVAAQRCLAPERSSSILGL